MKNVKFFGDSGNNFVTFNVQCADGKYHKAVQIQAQKPKTIIKILNDFRRAHRCVKHSSETLFGRYEGYEKGSLRWLACFNCKIKIYLHGHFHKEIPYRAAYLRYICNYLG